MTRALPRAKFSSPRLVRLLAHGTTSATGTEPKGDFAEKLGQWLHVSHAINLHAALDAHATGAHGSPLPKAAAGKTMADEVARTRTALASAIAKSCAADADAATSPARIRFPAPQAGTAMEVAALYAPYQRFHAAHQREMAQRLAPLRLAAREALATTSPTLKQLADMDAVFDAALAERERSLLAQVPAMLEQRFGQLLAAHRQAHAERSESAGEDEDTDDPLQWLQPGGWLARYREELQQLLLAELDLRLQPIIGLVETLSEALN